jgi:carbon starvation protein
LFIALLGAGAYAVIALRRAEPVNSVFLLTAAVCTYVIGYRFYSKWIAARALALNDRRATPCEQFEDGRDFVKTNPWVVFGHHFAAISGPGPLVGPVLAAQFGYLPGTLWILIGVVLGGAVQDMVILAASTRRDGRSLAQMVRDVVHPDAEILHDTSKPDGMPRKLLDTSRMESLGWHASIPLREGIEATYRWFESSEWTAASRSEND